MKDKQLTFFIEGFVAPHIVYVNVLSIFGAALIIQPIAGPDVNIHYYKYLLQ